MPSVEAMAHIVARTKCLERVPPGGTTGGTLGEGVLTSDGRQGNDLRRPRNSRYNGAMPRVQPSTVLILVGMASLLAGITTFGLRLVRQIDDMMFVPHPRDRATMANALRARFGDRVELLAVPVVNRDVNGFAGLVRGKLPEGTVVTREHVFAFERLKGRDVCLMTTRPYELPYLRSAFLARFPEAR